MTVTQSEIACALGIDKGLVSRYRKQGMPTSSIEAARTWHRDNVRPMAGGLRAPSTDGAALNDHAAPDYHAARARREHAEARIAELKQAELEGELIRVDAVRKAAAAALVAARETLLQAPARLAQQLAAEADPARIHELLMNEMRATLHHLAGMADHG